MPAPVVHLGAVVTCMHAGVARSAALCQRVLVSGQPVATMAALYVVTGCALANTATPPCVAAKWVTAATRVFVGGVPVVTQVSRAICAPTGQPPARQSNASARPGHMMLDLLLKPSGKVGRLQFASL